MKDLMFQLETGVYEFKEPWRPTDRSLAIVVPIVIKEKTTREYVVLEEVKEKVRIVDTGGIKRIRIEGDVDRPTFVRGGTMLKGKTQGRAIQFGIVVTPQKAERIPVHCIHASRGIRPGALFRIGGYAPRQVYSRILSDRNQSRTWSEVSNYSSHMMAEASRVGAVRCYSALSSVPRDDLLKVAKTVQSFRRDLKEILKQIPDYVDQVGTVIIDPEGVLGLEMYDHPDSWKAFSESITRSYAEALVKEDKTGIFKPNMAVIIPLIQKLLKNMEQAEEEEVFHKNNAKTVILKTEGYVGEYTCLDGRSIHLLITRRNPQRAPIRRTEHIRRRTSPSRQSTAQRLAKWGKRIKQRIHARAQSFT